jgi:hypothetical protein
MMIMSFPKFCLLIFSTLCATSVSLLFSSASSPSCFQPHRSQRTRTRANTCCFILTTPTIHHRQLGTNKRDPDWTNKLKASSSSNDDNDNKRKKAKGVYVRPSAAVERGSGFFFPGLEGPRVRLVVGSLLLVATVGNHVYSSSTSLFSEALAVLCSLLVLLQGAIETSKEGRIETIAARTKTKIQTQTTLPQQPPNDDDDDNNDNGNGNTAQPQSWIGSSRFHASNGDDDAYKSWKERVEWSATSYLSLTPATHMILIHQQQSQEQSSSSSSTTTTAAAVSASIDYWLGATEPSDSDSDTRTTTTAESAASAALQAIQQSTSGRVALPSDHPAAVALPEDYRRCVLLQRISPNACWMVGSNDLLASFTKQDLLWLGQLGKYVVCGSR